MVLSGTAWGWVGMVLSGTAGGETMAARQHSRTGIEVVSDAVTEQDQPQHEE